MTSCRCSREIVDCHSRGTRYGIGVDPADGLLRAGEPGVQLTWMDAKVGDWVVTPRIGKPVEINALWYNALRLRRRLARDADPGEPSARTTRGGERPRESFCSASGTPARGYLPTWSTAPTATTDALRPNQIFAVSLLGRDPGLDGGGRRVSWPPSRTRC